MSAGQVLFVCIGKSHNGVIYRGAVEVSPGSKPVWKERRVRKIEGLLSNSAACSIPNGIFLVGGNQEGRESDSRKCQVLTWNAAGDHVVVRASQTVHEQRDSSAAAASYPPDYIFVAGGDGGGGMEVFSADQGSWIKMERWPVDCSWHRLVTLDSSLYALGGRSENVLGHCARMSLREFCHGTPARRLGNLVQCAYWQPLEEMNVKRHSFAAVTAYGRIVVIGGTNGARALSSIEIYNPHKNQWRLSRHELKIPRKDLSVLICDQNFLIVLNGVASNDKMVTQVEGIKILDLLNDDSRQSFQLLGSSESGRRPGSVILSPTGPAVGTLKEFDTPPPPACRPRCESEASSPSSRLSTKASQAEFRREGFLDNLKEKLPDWKGVFPWTRRANGPTKERAVTAPTVISVRSPAPASPARQEASPSDPFAWYYS